MWLRRVVVTSLLHSDPESYLQSVSPHLTAAAARDVLTAAKVIMLHCNRIDHAGACFAIGVSLLRELSKLRTAVDAVTAAEAEAVVATCSTCVACIWHGLSPSLLCSSLLLTFLSVTVSQPPHLSNKACPRVCPTCRQRHQSWLSACSRPVLWPPLHSGRPVRPTIHGVRVHHWVALEEEPSEHGGDDGRGSVCWSVHGSPDAHGRRQDCVHLPVACAVLSHWPQRHHAGLFPVCSMLAVAAACCDSGAAACCWLPQVVPNQLLLQSRTKLWQAFSSVIRKRVYTFSFGRVVATTRRNWTSTDIINELLTKFKWARDTRGVLVTTPTALKSLMLKYVEACRDRSSMAKPMGQVFALLPCVCVVNFVKLTVRWRCTSCFTCWVRKQRVWP